MCTLFKVDAVVVVAGGGGVVSISLSMDLIVSNFFFC
jgi:hypoxanthine phosphoribosyltransferase